MRLLASALLALVLFSAHGAAAPTFSERVAVTAAAGAAVFHHPDSAGRKNIAVSDTEVAVVWEDNRDGTPQVYVALKSVDEMRFRPEFKLSSEAEAYEPSIAALGRQRFVVAWEQDERIVARALNGKGEAGPLMTLDNAPARQVALAPLGADHVAVAYMRQEGKHRRVVVTTLTVKSAAGAIAAESSRPVEAEAPTAEQLYPSIAVTPDGWCVAWEDRRHGHTRLLWSHSVDGVRFSQPRHLNEFQANRSEFDKGSGVTRVALTRFGERGVAAVWMDKRDGGKAYAIVGAVSHDGGREFGEQVRIHDDFGDETLHYNPAIAGNAAGRLIVAWDDLRDETADLWLSEHLSGRWSDNKPVTPARTEVEESNASLVLDDEGGLHVVWITKPAVGKATRLWYARGRLP
ncbi:MAG: sialidase family protein [Thiotrichales bacterium]